MRFLSRGSQFVVDILVLGLAFALAFLFRFELDLTTQWTKLLFFAGPYVVLLEYLVLLAFGVPRFAWRYISMRDALWVVVAISTSTLLLVGLRLGLEPIGGYSRFAMLPLGVIAMNSVLASVGIIGVRGLRRFASESKARKRRESLGTGPRTRTLLLGAGKAGALVAREIKSRPDMGIDPIGFLDDNKVLIGTQLHGLRVHGAIEDIQEVASRLRIKSVLITIAKADGTEIRRITRLCQEAGLKTKIIPGIAEIVAGDLQLSRIRDVAIEDLLGREPVVLDDVAIAGVVENRVCLVSGAGGSIGSELCRQICRYSPKQLLLLEKSENALFHVHRELIASFPETDIIPIVADVCDEDRIDQVFRDEHPQVVFHAAAHKHVPLMEANVGEAVKNNIAGTRCLANAADMHGVDEFVMISTDKAVNPTSVMGTTKRVAEIYIQALSQRSKTRFVAVRFGNVLGSAGSVIPIFKEQLAAGGPITVTDPEMQRYFMTIPEASQLVLQAASMGNGGEIFVLDMGKPIKIVDLARDLVSLSGFVPDEDIQIVFTGMRPGEKLFEELHVHNEEATKTRHPKIYIGHIAPHDLHEVQTQIDSLGQLVDCGDSARIRQALGELVPEYNQQLEPPIAAQLG